MESKKQATKKLNEQNKILSFTVTDITTLYFSDNLLSIHFDTFQSKDNYLEIDLYTLLQTIDTDFLNNAKEHLINYIKNK